MCQRHDKKQLLFYPVSGLGRMGGYNITVDEPEKSYLLCFTKLELVEIFFNPVHAKELFGRRVYCLLNLHPVLFDAVSDNEFFNDFHCPPVPHLPRGVQREPAADGAPVQAPGAAAGGRGGRRAAVPLLPRALRLGRGARHPPQRVAPHRHQGA